MAARRKKKSLGDFAASMLKHGTRQALRGEDADGIVRTAFSGALGDVKQWSEDGDEKEAAPDGDVIDTEGSAL